MPAKTDYIPRPDSEFDSWQGNFMSAVEAHKEALGLSDAELGALRAKAEAWDAAYADHAAKQAAAFAASRRKTDERAGYERELRSHAQRLQTHPSVTDAERAALGITVRLTTRTKAPAPSTRPLARVDSSHRLRHTLHITDESGARAKPPGARACELWGAVGDQQPADPSDFHLLAYCTSTPHVVEYKSADAGKVAYYILRWVNSRGDKGPWSLTVSATISA